MGQARNARAFPAMAKTYERKSKKMTQPLHVLTHFAKLSLRWHLGPREGGNKPLVVFRRESKKLREKGKKS